jgi:lipopolysaccharide transport system ATP-binding protein
MSNNVISIDNVFKCYQLGSIGTGTVKGDLKRWWARQRGKPDPYRLIGEAYHGYRLGETLWALKDINLQVQEGEVLGIIGRNGAGKSTLLKILSEVTAPTTGEIKIKGRIASLLEVGTGFHPDLTGRENVFLNGAIMGMSRKEIDQKFDEIVDFSGVEKFIDTPVKRYSSGMCVRLAFAVAAHLESKILLVDEVLAVGDAEFQKKCLGRMGVVAKEGRTVLFVSHLMTAVRSLCTNSILLENGSVLMSGQPQKVIEAYLKTHDSNVLGQEWKNPEIAPGNDLVRFKRIWINVSKKNKKQTINITSPLQFGVEYWNLTGANLQITLHLLVENNNVVFDSGSFLSVGWQKFATIRGLLRSTCEIPANLLNSRTYQVQILVVKDNSRSIFELNDALSFEVQDDQKRSLGWFEREPGVVHPLLHWKTEVIEQKGKTD